MLATLEAPFDEAAGANVVALPEPAPPKGFGVRAWVKGDAAPAKLVAKM